MMNQQLAASLKPLLTNHRRVAPGVDQAQVLASLQQVRAHNLQLGVRTTDRTFNVSLNKRAR